MLTLQVVVLQIRPAMSSMDALLEAAAEDIKLIDCLGPEDLCLDPTSANGLKPVNHSRLVIFESVPARLTALCHCDVVLILRSHL